MFVLQKTNALVAQTLSTLLAPSAKLLVLTSTSVPFEVLSRVYALAQLGALRTCEHVKVEHEGGRIQVGRVPLSFRSRLGSLTILSRLFLSRFGLPQNTFGMWGTWEGAEDFMKP